ncbi:hypothetical protein BN2497_3951 [Janthinobacterium sp. CG23_2]|nr:hypothetical protein BN2497_3951 [Janthinobacterium sp. CG23_2]CUU28373.1 hypothetical protein BN3177_3951 [Janthinobacterium sp. CG23_2]
MIKTGLRVLAAFDRCHLLLFFDGGWALAGLETRAGVA